MSELSSSLGCTVINLNFNILGVTVDIALLKQKTCFPAVVAENLNLPSVSEFAEYKTFPRGSVNVTSMSKNPPSATSNDSLNESE